MAEHNCDHCGHTMDFYDIRKHPDLCHWCLHTIGHALDEAAKLLHNVAVVIDPDVEEGK